jgi:preprotein translocase SecE subunit
MPETKMDEKQAQQQPAPAASPASRAENFRLFARIWVVLMGLSWAGTIACLLSQVSWLGTASIGIGKTAPPAPAGASVFLSPAGLLAGLLVGAGIIVGVFKKLGDKLAYARPGLGRAVRMSAYGGIGALTLFGAYALYMAPSISSIWWKDILPAQGFFGKAFSLKPILFPAAGVFFAAMSGVFLLLNQEKWSDFLIETEGEIKKVSWPARKEYMGSAMIVVLVVAVVSMFLHYVDAGLSWLMQKWGVGF